MATIDAPLDEVVDVAAREHLAASGVRRARRAPSTRSSSRGGFHELIEPRPRARGHRGSRSSPTGSTSRPDGWRAVFRDEAVCGVCGEPCKRVGRRRSRRVRLRGRRRSRTAASRSWRPVSSRATGSPSTWPRGRRLRALRRLPRRRSGARASNVCGVLLEIPEPYDFQLSTARFRDFGSDGATVSHDGGLHRVVAGREVRVTAAPGGVAIEPWSEEAAHEIALAARCPVRPRRVQELGGRRAGARPDRGGAPGLPADAQSAAVRGARRCDHHAADLAASGRRDPREPRSALTACEHDVAWEFPTPRARRATARRAISRRSASRARRRSTCSSSPTRDLDLDALADARRRRGDRRAHRPSAGSAAGRRTGSSPAHLARPHAWPAGDLGVRKAVSTFYADGRQLSIEEVRRMGERFAPFENLSAQFLLAGARMAGYG